MFSQANLNADWHLSKHCKLTIFSWASVPILRFFDQQEKFATSAAFFTIDPGGKGSLHS